MNEIVKRNALGHPLPGGRSLNPGGRPRGAIQEVRELLGQHKQMFVEELLRLIRSDDEAIRLAAIKEGFDRLLGKAPIALDHTEPEGRAREAIQQLYLTAVQAANRPSDPIDVTPVPDARDGATEW
jgi:hypothetical protein